MGTKSDSVVIEPDTLRKIAAHIHKLAALIERVAAQCETDGIPALASKNVPSAIDAMNRLSAFINAIDEAYRLHDAAKAVESISGAIVAFDTDGRKLSVKIKAMLGLTADSLNAWKESIAEKMNAAISEVDGPPKRRKKNG